MNMMPRSDALDDPAGGVATPEAMLPFPAFHHLLRALADEIDAHLGAAERDLMLRSTGRRMARLLPIPPVASLDALQMEMNDRLAPANWGAVQLTLHVDEACLFIVHQGVPRAGAAGDPPGTWLLPVLEGLYQEWLANQPGGDPVLEVRQGRLLSNGRVLLRCARPQRGHERAEQRRRP